MEFYKDQNFNNMALGCPVDLGALTALYKVTYSVKRSPFDSWLYTESHAAIASFDSEEARDKWIEWHKANTPAFVVLKVWKDKTKEDLQAIIQKRTEGQEQREARKAELARKRERFAYLATKAAIKAKS